MLLAILCRWILLLKYHLGAKRFRCVVALCVLGNEIFKKNYKTNHPDGCYPDGGCSFETLSELKTVNAGEFNTLSEIWSVSELPCEVDTRDDNSIDNLIKNL